MFKGIWTILGWGLPSETAIKGGISCQNVTSVPLPKKLLRLPCVWLSFMLKSFVQCSNTFNTICYVLRVARNMSGAVWRSVCVELVIYGKFLQNSSDPLRQELAKYKCILYVCIGNISIMYVAALLQLVLSFSKMCIFMSYMGTRKSLKWHSVNLEGDFIIRLCISE